MRTLGIYIHVPFCVRKCAYCDFLSEPAARERQKEYVEALKREIAREADKYAGYEVRTVFFGGGTPSILEAEDIEGILDCIRRHYKFNSGTRITDAEIFDKKITDIETAETEIIKITEITEITDTEVTLEMNPKTADTEKFMRWKQAGINRLSIGLQSADNAELKLLGRIHTYEDFLQTYHQARETGFANINIDLMSALPGQHMESWTRTLEKVTALQPEHISAYSLIIEEGTRLYDRLAEYPPVPDEDEDRQMYQMTKQILAEKGYQRYEISNYAKKGYACRHNNIYWQRGIGHTANYAGFGLGASSLFENVRWKNTQDMGKYLRAFAKGGFPDKDMESDTKKCEGETVKEDIQELSKNDWMEEFMFLGLRMTGGVSKAEFAKSFGVEMETVYGTILQKWIKYGMLVQKGDTIRLTDAGIDVSNVVLADFLLCTGAQEENSC